jgi:hypothetical protein
MLLGFGSMEAARRLQQQAEGALGVTAPIKTMAQAGRILYAVELPPMTASEYAALRAGPERQPGGARRR